MLKSTQLISGVDDYMEFADPKEDDIFYLASIQEMSTCKGGISQET